MYDTRVSLARKSACSMADFCGFTWGWEGLERVAGDCRWPRFDSRFGDGFVRVAVVGRHTALV